MERSRAAHNLRAALAKRGNGDGAEVATAVRRGARLAPRARRSATIWRRARWCCC